MSLVSRPPQGHINNCAITTLIRNCLLTYWPSAEAETGVADSVKDLNQSDDRGERTADNIRYGQNISESGQGGMTAGNTGTANSDGEYFTRDLKKSSDVC